MICLLLIIKIIKVLKMLFYNSTISYLAEFLSKNEIIDEYGNIIVTIILLLFSLNMTTCIFIFLGKYSYPIGL